MVVGSFASSVYGRLRTTYDADLIANLTLGHVSSLVDAMKGDFYVDRGQVEQAIRSKRSFNLIHLQSAFKVDIFPLANRPFDREAFSRRVKQQILRDSEVALWTQTAEDTLLSKLEWFRMGQEVSDTQWQDVLGVLKRQAGRLDVTYLHKWANELGVADLLERAFGETQETPSAGQ